MIQRLTSLLTGTLLIMCVAGVFAQSTDQAKDRASERKAILAASKAFAEAFAKGDADALAEMWTEQGEYENDHGQAFRGRAAIGKAFAELFKSKGASALEVHVTALRFPGKDCAIEEGMLRTPGSAHDLPATTLYRAIHVRENGVWKIALAREWGAGQDRIEDLEWLVGTWNGAGKEQETTLSFARDKAKPFLVGHFEIKTRGKVVSSGTMKIGFDPQLGRLRSWHFDDDGGHGQALWVRDGNRWLLDARGALADGTETASVNMITRLGPDEILWRSIDRVAGRRPLPDTLPVKLKRAR